MPSARGALHASGTSGRTPFRKVDLAYLRDRASYVPAVSIRPKKKVKKAPKKGKREKRRTHRAS